MRVMMLLKSDAKAEAGGVPDEKMLTAMGNYNEALVNAGVLKGAEGLRPSKDGARIRVSKGGKTMIIDGPFAEAKEVVAGYFMLETKSLQEAIDWAKRIPSEGSEGEGEIELRPIFELEDFPVDPAEQPGGWRDQEIAARQDPKLPGSEKGVRWISFIKADKNTEAKAMPSDKLLNEMGALMQEMVEQGVMIAGEGLTPSAEGAKLRLSKHKVSVIDGPFSEAKELIAGFSMYRAKTKAEAIEWARRCIEIHVNNTDVDAGEIEVRRVYETEEIPLSENEQADGWRDQEKRLRDKLGQ